jgi:hypothetical protein
VPLFQTRRHGQAGYAALPRRLHFFGPSLRRRNGCQFCFSLALEASSRSHVPHVGLLTDPASTNGALPAAAGIHAICTINDMKDPSGEQSDLVVTPGGPRRRDQVHLVRPGELVRRNEDGTYTIVSEASISHIEGAHAMADDFVITPGGVRHKSLVHLIEPGAVLDGSAGRLRKLHWSGRVLADLGPIAQRAANRPLMPDNLAPPPRKVPGIGNGWIAYAYWSNTSGHTITTFSTTWTVPPPPETQSGQLLYLFNGIQNSTMIYQPVLRERPVNRVWKAA